MAVRIAARLQPGPGAVALRIADDEQQGGGQEPEPVVVVGPQHRRAVVIDDQRSGHASAWARSARQVGGFQIPFPAVGDEEAADGLPEGAHLGQVDVGTVRTARPASSQRGPAVRVGQQVHARVALPGVDEGLQDQERHGGGLGLDVGDPGRRRRRHEPSLATRVTCKRP